MCGRFALYQPVSQHRDHFHVTDDGFDFGPRYNIAPSQAVPIIRADHIGNRTFQRAQWGLIPSWAKDSGTLPKPINAKSETAAIKPMFRQAFRKSRVLVPADAFYEWKPVTGQKQPYLIHLKDGAPFGLGGLLEHWQGPAGEITTFTILTTAANSLMATIHDRMPVIIAPENYAEWLDSTVNDVHRLHTMISPYPECSMEAYPVSKRVNSPADEGVELVERL